MSKSINPFGRVDELITDLLTKFCWWSDIHFGKDNVWWANTTFIFLFPILDVLAIFFIDVKTEGTIGYFFGSCFASITVLYIINRFSYVKTIISNARKSPNKNRTSIEMMIYKVTSVISFFMWQAINSTSGIIYSSTASNLILAITIITFFYFLCTEPIPPAVRRKKLEEKSLRTLEHQLQASRQYK